MTPLASQSAGWNSSLRRSPMGAAKRARVQHEAQQALALEGTSDRLGLFDLHKVDWLHCVTPRTDKGSLRAGFPDYLLLGKDWMAFLEIKHGRVPGAKGIGRLDPSQIAFHGRLRAAGQEVLTAWLPEDLQAVNAWLFQKTGIECSVDGLS